MILSIRLLLMLIQTTHPSSDFRGISIPEKHCWYKKTEGFLKNVTHQSHNLVLNNNSGIKNRCSWKNCCSLVWYSFTKHLLLPIRCCGKSEALDPISSTPISICLNNHCWLQSSYCSSIHVFEWSLLIASSLPFLPVWVVSHVSGRMSWPQITITSDHQLINNSPFRAQR